MSVHFFQSIDTVMSMKDVEDRLSKHQINVSNIAGMIALQMNIDNDYLEVIRRAGLFHDIGKIGIPNEILYKRGKLTQQEWAIMKLHPTTGSQLLSNRLENINLLGFAEVIKAIRHHHERWDGQGYPDRLKGTEIPLAARIIAVADTYDAMTSKRSYRKPLSHEEAIKDIVRCSGTQFDPTIVKCFIKLNLKIIK